MSCSASEAVEYNQEHKHTEAFCFAAALLLVYSLLQIGRQKTNAAQAEAGKCFSIVDY
jgi:hypothetical protein